MKRIGFIAVFPIVFWMLSFTAAAESGQSAKLKLSKNVVVSGIQLEPGTYVVRWAGIGSGVQVKFLRGDNEVVALIGTVIQKESDYDSFTTRPDETGARILSEIAFSNVTLVLTPPEASVAE